MGSTKPVKPHAPIRVQQSFDLFLRWPRINQIRCLQPVSHVIKRFVRDQPLLWKTDQSSHPTLAKTPSIWGSSKLSFDV
jgi:hypothetical protein